MLIGGVTAHDDDPDAEGPQERVDHRNAPGEVRRVITGREESESEPLVVALQPAAARQVEGAFLAPQKLFDDRGANALPLTCGDDRDRRKLPRAVPVRLDLAHAQD